MVRKFSGTFYFPRGTFFVLSKSFQEVFIFLAICAQESMFSDQEESITNPKSTPHASEGLSLLR